MAQNTPGWFKGPRLPFWRKSDIANLLFTQRNTDFAHILMPLTIPCLIFMATTHTKTEIWLLKKHAQNTLASPTDPDCLGKGKIF